MKEGRSLNERRRIISCILNCIILCRISSWIWMMKAFDFYEPGEVEGALTKEALYHSRDLLTLPGAPIVVICKTWAHQLPSLPISALQVTLNT